MLTPGRYLGKIIEYGVQKPKHDGDRPSVFVKFQISDSNDTITWYGNMGDGNPDPTGKPKKKPYQISIETLVKMGLRGSNPYALARFTELGLEADALDDSRDYELSLKNDTYNGKTSLRVKYVGIPGQGGVTSIGEKEAMAMAGFNFDAEVMSIRKELKIADAPSSAQIDEDIPF